MGDSGADRVGREVAVEIGGEDERHLHLGAGLQERRERDHVAVGEAHVVEQDAEVGLVDPDLALHGLGRQADLAADDARPRAHARVDDALLDPVGDVDVRAPISSRTGAAGRPLAAAPRRRFAASSM